MHQVVVRERRVKGGGLTSIGSDGLDTDPNHVAFLGQEGRSLLGQARGVRSVLPRVDIVAGVSPFRPVRSQQHPSSCRNAAILFFPLPNSRWRHQIIGVFGGLSTDINHAGGPDKLLRRNAIDGVVRQVLTGDPVHRSIKVSARVFPGLKSIPVPGGTAIVVPR